VEHDFSLFYLDQRRKPRSQSRSVQTHLNNEQISDALGRILAEISQKMHYFCNNRENKKDQLKSNGKYPGDNGSKLIFEMNYFQYIPYQPGIDLKIECTENTKSNLSKEPN